MKKRIALFMLLLLTVSSLRVLAQQISCEKSLSYARAFRQISQTSAKTRTSALPTSFKLVYAGGDNSNPDYYIYNVGNDHGFVIIAGDERMEPILGYSLSGHFDSENIPDGLAYMLESYTATANKWRNQKNVRTLSKASAVTPLADITQVGPLLGDIAWNQDSPYNDQCPLIDGKRALTGCVATAAGQIMKYHAYPEKGTGKKGGIDFANTTYDWDNMLPTYNKQTPGTTEQRAEVAKLLHHVGVSVGMIYGTDGSASDNRTAARALKQNFDYSRKMDNAIRLNYTDEEWIALLKNEIDHQRPVLYSGLSLRGGHSFVCDGYDSEGRLSFNFGWGYKSTFMKLAAVEFSSSNAAILGFVPNTKAASVAPQISLFSSIHVSSLSLKKGKKFNAGMRISNYGLENFNNELGIAIYQGDKLISVLKHKKVSVPLNKYESGPETIKSQDLNFTDITLPTTLSDGSYQLCCVTQSNSEWYKMTGLAASVDRNVDMTVSGNNVVFSYPIGSDQVVLELSKELEMSIANNVGIARFALKNVNPDYDYAGNIYILGRKEGSLVPQLFATVSTTVGIGTSVDMEISDIPLSTGDYTFFVAYSPIYPEGAALGAVPLEPEALNFYAYNVPKESVDYDVDFTALKALPASYKQYKDETEFFTDGTIDHDKMAPWRYVGSVKKANSFFNADVMDMGRVHTLVSEAVTVKDVNAVLNWTVRSGGEKQSAIYEVYLTTKGQGLNDFTEEDLIYSKTFLWEDEVRLSLSEYAGKTVYIVFKHSMGDATAVELNLHHIRLLNIQSPKDISVQSVQTETYNVANEKLPVTVTVRNHAPFNVKKFTAHFTVGEQTYTEEIECNIGYDETYTFTSDQALVIGNPGDALEVKVNVEMEGEDPALLGNNNSTAKVTVYEFAPHKSMLVYKTSKTGCAACAATYTELDKLEELYPAQFAGVSIWQDQTTLPEYLCDDFKSFYSGSTPAVYFNNKGLSYNVISEIVSNAKTTFNKTAPVSNVSVEAAFADADSRKLKIKIKARFAIPLKGDYKLGAIIQESNVKASSYPINGNSPKGDQRTMNHIPVGTVGGVRGAEGKVISNPEAGKEYEYECEYTLPEETAIRYKKENVQVIGVVFTPQGNVDNSSIDSYYVRIPKTDGLTFIAEDGYCPFKEIYEVEATGKDNNYTSITNNRATVTAGKDFSFRIAKDNSIGNRKVRVLMNRKANNNEEIELLPDLKGRYTLKEVHQYYFLEVQILDEEDDSPTAIRKEDQLILSGNWTATDFSRLDLTDTSLTSIDMTGIAVPQNAADIVPANPNLLIYASEDALAPLSWKNVVKGTEAAEIALTDGYAFNNRIDFRAGTITYERNHASEEWTSIYLPFSMEIASLPKGVSMEGYASCNGSALKFEPVESGKTEANTPYMIHITAEGDDAKVYMATQVSVPKSDAHSIEYGDYRFKGTLKPIEKETTGWFTLNADGKSFVATTAGISAFRAYMEYTGTKPQPQTIAVTHKTDDPTGMENGSVQKGFNVYAAGGKLYIYTDQPMTVHIYSIDGREVCTLEATQGANIVPGLSKGFYLVNNKKVSIQ